MEITEKHFDLTILFDVIDNVVKQVKSIYIGLNSGKLKVKGTVSLIWCH